MKGTEMRDDIDIDINLQDLIKLFCRNRNSTAGGTGKVLDMLDNSRQSGKLCKNAGSQAQSESK